MEETDGRGGTNYVAAGELSLSLFTSTYRYTGDFQFRVFQPIIASSRRYEHIGILFSETLLHRLLDRGFGRCRQTLLPVVPRHHFPAREW